MLGNSKTMLNKSKSVNFDKIDIVFKINPGAGATPRSGLWPAWPSTKPELPPRSCAAQLELLGFRAGGAFSPLPLNRRSRPPSLATACSRWEGRPVSMRSPSATCSTMPAGPLLPAASPLGPRRLDREPGRTQAARIPHAARRAPRRAPPRTACFAW